MSKRGRGKEKANRRIRHGLNAQGHVNKYADRAGLPGKRELRPRAREEKPADSGTTHSKSSFNHGTSTTYRTSFHGSSPSHPEISPFAFAESRTQHQEPRVSYQAYMLFDEEARKSLVLGKSLPDHVKSSRNKTDIDTARNGKLQAMVLDDAGYHQAFMDTESKGVKIQRVQFVGGEFMPSATFAFFYGRTSAHAFNIIDKSVYHPDRQAILDDLLTKVEKHIPEYEASQRDQPAAPRPVSSWAFLSDW